MSEIKEEDFYYAIANLMVFYKGSISYRELESMPIPEFLKLQEFAVKIRDGIEKETEKQVNRQRNGKF